VGDGRLKTYCIMVFGESPSMAYMEARTGVKRMCGKFTQMSSWQEVHAFSHPLAVKQPADQAVVSTPMRFANIMRLDAQGERVLVAMRWGFAGKGDRAPTRPRHMHARSETIDTLPTFRESFARARGILMVETFNEGEELPNGKTRQWVITPQDGEPIAIAVICDQWINGAETLETFIQVTVPANELISRITDRMPAILPRESWAAWLGETGASLAGIKALLQTFEDKGSWTMVEQAPGARTRRTTGQPTLF
jgi:putative SOS response-associated peptidase YedK